MGTSLVVMAAGLGSRYGGDKQVDGVGPGGEMLMEYAMYDAILAGFDRIVLVIKPGMEGMMDALTGYLRRRTARSGRALEVVYVRQDFSSLPEFYTVPPQRSKPFGTVHALLCAAGAVDGPFCVINADDFYGRTCYGLIYDRLQTLPPQGRGVMVGYALQNTASRYGTVSRGICAVEDGCLRAIRECKRIALCPDGRLQDLDTGETLPGQTAVSMNFWGFTPGIFPELEAYFADFLRALPQGEEKAECLLPVMVGHALERGTLAVDVLSSHQRWFGMTYHQDRDTTAQALAALHREGVYPPSLREG